jgi:hypothetical protein
MDVATLAGLLREAEEHHGPYEASAPPHHWSSFYAAYIVAREEGHTPEKADADARKHMEAVLR